MLAWLLSAYPAETRQSDCRAHSNKVLREPQVQGLRVIGINNINNKIKYYDFILQMIWRHSLKERQNTKKNCIAWNNFYELFVL